MKKSKKKFKFIEFFKNQKKGFTLIEILAVIVILALIMTVVVPNALKTSDSVKLAALETKKENIVSAAVLYGTDRDSLFEKSDKCIRLYDINVGYLIGETNTNKKDTTETLIQESEDKTQENCYNFIKVKVSELADNKYIKYDEKEKDGTNIVTNPADDENNLNDDYVYIYKKNNRIYAVYSKQVEEIKKKEEEKENPDECVGSSCDNEPDTKPLECQNPDECKDKLPDPPTPDLEVKEEATGPCKPSETEPKYITTSENTKTFTPSCSGRYKIVYAGGAGGAGQGGKNKNIAAKEYSVEAILNKDLLVIGCIGKIGESNGACSKVINTKNGSAGTCGQNKNAGGINVCDTSANGNPGNQGKCTCGFQSATCDSAGLIHCWGSLTTDITNTGGGGAATYISIPSTTGNINDTIIVSGTGGTGGDNSSGTIGGAGGTIATKNTDKLVSQPTATGNSNTSNGYVKYYLLEASDADSYEVVENCKNTETLLIDSTNKNMYVPAFMVNCTGKYKIELAGGAGGGASNSSAGDKDKIAATNPEGGQVITTIVNLKLKDIVSYGLGRKGSSSYLNVGGSGGAPDGKSGTNGIYSVEGKVLVSSGGGGGGGSSTFTVNNVEILSANGGKGSTGGHLNLYPTGSGGSGGIKNIDMSSYSVTSTNTNTGDGYIKITYIP